MFGAPAHKAKLDPAQEAVPKRSRGGDAMKGHQHMPTSRAQQARERWFDHRRGCYNQGKRNLENDQELTLRTGITHVLNLAPDVTLGPG